MFHVLALRFPDASHRTMVAEAFTMVSIGDTEHVNIAIGFA